ncbi:MAPEG family protein [Simiduia litorea]|uniref:MAPEG family protein n=1 Tax=Simiduia litorea TaxID=1435348 RepID=UPI0036F34B38
MSIAIACLIAAAALIYISKIPVAIAMAKLDGNYDNSHPRAQQSRLTGFGARAMGAHQNAIEAFPLFAAGVLVALWAEAPQATVNYLCVAFVVARILYMCLYWLNWDKLRSTIWAVGLVCSFWLMALAL